MELAAGHPSGTLNFEVASKFLENSFASGLGHFHSNKNFK